MIKSVGDSGRGIFIRSGMSGVSLPVTRPIGRALLVGNPASRAQALGVLESMGYGCGEADDPYAAMAEICRRPMVYRALILGLGSIYAEELAMIRTIKWRFPHMEVWLAQTDGRQSAMAEGMRLGADGLLSEDGLHRVGLPPAAEPNRSVSGIGTLTADVSAPHDSSSATDEAEHRELPVDPDCDLPVGEPVLTADELRALLQEQPAPHGEE